MYEDTLWKEFLAALRVLCSDESGAKVAVIDVDAIVARAKSLRFSLKGSDRW